MIYQKFRLCFLLDMDGVLVESEGMHVEKTRTVAKNYGVDLPLSAFNVPQTFSIPDAKGNWAPTSMKLYGAGDKNIYYWLLAQKPALRDVLSLDMWHAQLLDHYTRNADRIKARDGVVDLLRGFHDRGALMAVNTSGIPAQVAANYRALAGLQERLLFTLTAADVTKNKPDPESYLTAKARVLAMQAAGLIPADEKLIFVAVEDSGSGHTATYRAGLPCVQFLLEGQKPVYREATSFYGAALTAQDVGREVTRLFDYELNKRLAPPVMLRTHASARPSVASCQRPASWPILIAA